MYNMERRRIEFILLTCEISKEYGISTQTKVTLPLY